MFRIIVLLVLPVVAELKFLSGFLHVSIKDPDVILLSHETTILDDGHSVLRRVCFPFLPPGVFSIHSPNKSNFVSLDHRMVDQKLASDDLQQRPGELPDVFFLSSGVFRGLRPRRPPLFKTRSILDRHTFVPAQSSVSIIALVVVRELLLTSQQIFLANLGDSLRFLPRPRRF